MSVGTATLSGNAFLDLAEEEGYERWLIRGELRERPLDLIETKGKSMTLRSPTHACTTAATTGFLHAWLITLPTPRPKLYNGDIYFRLRRDPETNVGIDIALATVEQANASQLYDRLIEGAPLLAVEVLSPSDTTEDVSEKIRELLDAGPPLVWLIDPYDFTVTVYRPGEEPVLYNRNQELGGDPVLPGFRVQVALLFQ